MATWLDVAHTTVDFNGTAPAGTLIHSIDGYSGGYPTFSGRMLYCNLPVQVKNKGGTSFIFKFINPNAISFNMTKQWNEVDRLYLYFSFELFADELDLDTLSETNNPNGTGDSNIYGDAICSFIAGDHMRACTQTVHKNTTAIIQTHYYGLSVAKSCRIFFGYGSGTELTVNRTASLSASGIKMLSTSVDF